MRTQEEAIALFWNGMRPCDACSLVRLAQAAG